MRRFFAEHAADDAGDLWRSLAAAEYDFGKTLAQRAVVIDFCVAEVFERKLAEFADGLVEGELSGF